MEHDVFLILLTYIQLTKKLKMKKILLPLLLVTLVITSCGTKNEKTTAFDVDATKKNYKLIMMSLLQLFQKRFCWIWKALFS